MHFGSFLVNVSFKKLELGSRPYKSKNLVLDVPFNEYLNKFLDI